MSELKSYCLACECQVEVEPCGPGLVMCVQCGEEFDPKEVEELKPEISKFANFCIAKVLKVDELKDGLKKLSVDVGRESPVTIVTSAKISVGHRVVVALEGAIVPAGKVVGQDPDAVVVKATSVGGVKSHGMLCDSPMLGWVGGAKGVAQVLPDTFVIGDLPPETRPRK
jgi:tRNA-binding EMAP/Myf-like protein